MIWFWLISVVFYGFATGRAQSPANTGCGIPPRKQMSAEENAWRTSTFRQSVVAKIDEEIQRAGVPITKNSNDMEDYLFQKVKTREEYLVVVAKLILHVREMSSKKGGGAGGAQGMQQDPINALQTLARTGTGNNQMMGLGPGQGSGMVPQASQSATNLLQTLNQRPGQQLPNMQGLQNKMPDMGMVPGGPQGNEGLMMGAQNAGFPVQRTNQFFRQTPSPTAPSPVGLGTAPPSNQMAASSPALVPSPTSQLTPISAPQRSAGIYISKKNAFASPEFHGLGVRIKDDVLMTEDGPFVLTSACPKTVDEVENLAGSMPSLHL